MEARNINVSIDVNRMQSTLSFDIFDNGKKIDRVNIGDIVKDFSDNPTQEELEAIVERALRSREQVIKRRQAAQEAMRAKAEKITKIQLPEVVTKRARPALDVKAEIVANKQRVTGATTGDAYSVIVDGEHVALEEGQEIDIEVNGKTAVVATWNNIGGREYDRVTERVKLPEIESPDTPVESPEHTPVESPPVEGPDIISFPE